MNKNSPLDERVRTARLLGADPALVLHGGGNSSVKTRARNLFGDEEELLLIKGSGSDLATIDPTGFTALQIADVRRLSTLDVLSDLDMASELLRCRFDPSAAAPSVEAIMHALIPFTFVDHTHADAIVALTNTLRGIDLVQETFGERVLIFPYVMPGFDLARAVAARVDEIHEGIEGLILMNHGIVTFGDTAKESYERMISLVASARAALRRGDEAPAPRPPSLRGAVRRARLALLRQTVSAAAGSSMLMRVCDDERTLAFAQRVDVADLAGRGPATPDHVIRTKPVPLVGENVSLYKDEYQQYFARGAARARTQVDSLDSAPRIVILPDIGIVSIGRTAKDAVIAEDIYRHTIEIILDAEEAGGYSPVGESDLFDVEYWDLEQAKLRLAGAARPLAGQVALVTGAASGIGRAVTEKFLAEGAAVVGVDIDPGINSMFRDHAWLPVQCDITDLVQVQSALDSTADRFGGLDILVLNAGIFPSAIPVAETNLSQWQRVMRINLDSAVAILRDAHPMLALSPTFGRVIVVGSKNVAAPGPGAAAYSASKAALTQLARVTALEWAPDGIRVNVIHPDAVFDTALWGGGILEARASHYGMSVDDYRRRNLLHIDITSRDVAELAFGMTGPSFAQTTGAQVPIDGGNERVI